MENMNLHWHRELEINIILHGTVIAQIDDQLYELHAGEGIFINSNALHLTKAKFPEHHTEHLPVIFAPEFLAPEDSMIFQEEIAPFWKRLISAVSLFIRIFPGRTISLRRYPKLPKSPLLTIVHQS